jgi:hypothetical protein
MFFLFKSKNQKRDPSAFGLSMTRKDKFTKILEHSLKLNKDTEREINDFFIKFKKEYWTCVLKMIRKVWVIRKLPLQNRTENLEAK